MAVRFQTRKDTAANWTSANPLLLQGERGLETDTGLTKMGDGTTSWTSLAYEGGNIVTALPTAGVEYRGIVITLDGGAGVADISYICQKDASDTYAWVAI